jgi:hypothetical protein
MTATITIECRAQLEALGLWPLVSVALARSRSSRDRAHRRLQSCREDMNASRQLELQFDAPAQPKAKPPAPSSPAAPALKATPRPIPRPMDVEDIPIGSTVRTPTGALAEVVAYRGGRRIGGGQKDDHERLVCRYLSAKNRRFGTLVIKPELVQVVPKEVTHGA